KLATAIGIVLSMLSLLVHLFLANYSAGESQDIVYIWMMSFRLDQGLDPGDCGVR
ncbi:hypothetical protein EE612_026909, partial [Oryza sativa]